jgi:hypothetical protein
MGWIICSPAAGRIGSATLPTLEIHPKAHCERFRGNVITAIASDTNDIYIIIGIDEDAGKAPIFPKSAGS